jgi:hypothetical protein
VRTAAGAIPGQRGQRHLGSREDWRGLRGKLVHFPLNPLQSSRDPLVTKSTLNFVESTIFN